MRQWQILYHAKKKRKKPNKDVLGKKIHMKVEKQNNRQFISKPLNARWIPPRHLGRERN